MPRDLEQAYAAIKRLATAATYDMPLEAAIVVIERFALAFAEQRLQGSTDEDRMVYHAAIEVVTRCGR